MDSDPLLSSASPVGTALESYFRQSGNEKYIRTYEELGRFIACSGFQSVVSRPAAAAASPEAC